MFPMADMSTFAVAKAVVPAAELHDRKGRVAARQETAHGRELRWHSEPTTGELDVARDSLPRHVEEQGTASLAAGES